MVSILPHILCQSSQEGNKRWGNNPKRKKKKKKREKIAKKTRSGLVVTEGRKKKSLAERTKNWSKKKKIGKEEPGPGGCQEGVTKIRLIRRFSGNETSRLPGRKEKKKERGTGRIPGKKRREVKKEESQRRVGSPLPNEKAYDRNMVRKVRWNWDTQAGKKGKVGGGAFLAVLASKGVSQKKDDEGEETLIKTEK